MEISPGKLWGMRRLADDAGFFRMLAVDQRPPIKNLVSVARGTADATYEDVCDVKTLLVRHLAPNSSAVLLDPHYAYPAAIGFTDPSHGLILTLEDSIFDEAPRGRRSSAIDDWSVEKIKRTGADAVKVLAWYRPDADADVCRHQQDFVARIGAECVRWDIPFVFELLVYPFPGDESHTLDYLEHGAKRAELVIESVATFADPRFSVDLFKLESPIPAADVPNPDAAGGDEIGATQALFDALGSAAGRPWVMLSAGATKEQFRRVLTFAYRAGASGYLAGRAIWWDAAQQFPDLAAIAAELDAGGVAYMADINQLTTELAVPWDRHDVFGGSPKLRGVGPGFRSGYPGVESP